MDPATGITVALATVGFHLGQQRRRPPAATQYGVGDDQPVLHRQQMHVMRGVRDTVLGPAERVLDHLTLLRPAAPKVPELAAIGHPPGSPTTSASSGVAATKRIRPAAQNSLARS